MFAFAYSFYIGRSCCKERASGVVHMISNRWPLFHAGMQHEHEESFLLPVFGLVAQKLVRDKQCF